MQRESACGASLRLPRDRPHYSPALHPLSLPLSPIGPVASERAVKPLLLFLSPCAQTWKYEGSKTLDYYIRRRDSIRALSQDLEVPEEAAVATVMKQLIEGLSVRLGGSWMKDTCVRERESMCVCVCV